MNHELIETKNKKEEILAKIKEASIDKALLFCNKKRDIEGLAKSLEEAGYKAFALYNGLEEDSIKEVVKTFNRSKKIFIVCSDSVAKKQAFKKVAFVIGTDLPTRANRLQDIERVMTGKKPEPKVVKSQPEVAEKASEKKSEPVKKATPAKPATPNKGSFGGNIPEFLKIDVSHLIKGA